MNQAALRGTGTPLHFYIRTIHSLPHVFLFWSCLLCPACLCLFSFLSQTIPLETSSMTVSVGQTPFPRAAAISSTPLQPSLLALPLGQPFIPTRRPCYISVTAMRAALAPTVSPQCGWRSFCNPRVYFSCRFMGHTRQASGAHAKLCFVIWFFEPDVSGWWFLFFFFCFRKSAELAPNYY